MTIKKVITLTAPTCSGKTTAERLLTQKHGFGRFISHTTRQPRPGEVNGVDYHFVDKEFFTDNHEDFLEKITYEDNHYGIHASELARLEQDGVENVILVAEPVGVRQVRKWCAAHGIKVASVFLDVPAIVCFERLFARVMNDDKFTDNWKIYAKRASTLVDELQWRVNSLEGMVVVDAFGLTPEQVVEEILDITQHTKKRMQLG